MLSQLCEEFKRAGCTFLSFIEGSRYATGATFLSTLARRPAIYAAKGDNFRIAAIWKLVSSAIRARPEVDNLPPPSLLQE